MHYSFSCRSAGWLAEALDHLHKNGYSVIEDVLSGQEIDATRAAIHSARRAIVDEVGEDALDKAEWNALLLLMKYEPHFYRLLEVPQQLSVIDAVLSPSAILRFQIATILPPQDSAQSRVWKQNDFHLNFRFSTPGYPLTVDTMFALDRLDGTNGTPFVVPGSHHSSQPQSQEEMESKAVPVMMPPGSFLVLNSNLWHKEGQNESDSEVCVVTHQFARPFLKPYLDHVRALGTTAFEALPDRSRHLLGLYTQVPASLPEYYLPPEARKFRVSAR